MGTIVIIDDSAETRETLTELLEMEGHTVYSAPDGRAGLKVIADTKPQVAIVDMFMPEKDGVEVLQELNVRSPQTWIITISGGTDFMGQDVILKMSSKLGADAIFSKPVPHTDLIAKVNDLVSRE